MQENLIKSYRGGNIFKILFFIQAFFLSKQIPDKPQSSVHRSTEGFDLEQSDSYKTVAQLSFCVRESIGDLWQEKCPVSEGEEFTGYSTEIQKATPSLLSTSSADSKATQQALAKAIAKAKIHIKPDLRKEIAARPDGSRWLILLEKEIAQIKKVLPQTIHPDLLLKILQNPSFSIELVTYNNEELTAGGKFIGIPARYLPIANKVLIGSDTYTIDKERLQTLRNELHHVAIRYTNFRRQTSSEMNLPAPKQALKILRPFVNDFWKTDVDLRKKHRKALDEGFKRVQDFKNLLKKLEYLDRNTFTAKAAKKNLDKWLDAVKNYNANIYLEEIPDYLFKIVNKKMIKKKSGKKVISLSDGEAYIVSEHIDANMVILKYNYLKTTHVKDKGMAFIKDVERFKKEIDTHYSNSDYHSEAEGDLDLELSSFLQQIDPNILKVFFPEWCQYFSDYHEAADYCQIMA